MRFYGIKEEKSKQPEQNRESNLVRRAFSKMHRTRLKDQRPFGQVVGDAVISSIQTLLMIGGFIILFSVFTSLLNELNIIAIFGIILTPLMEILQIPKEITVPLFTGLFEITMGAEMISKLKSVPLVIQLTVVSFMLGFNGLSVQAQVISIIAKTDIRFLPYFFARILHAIIASILTIVLYQTYFSGKLLSEHDHTPVLQQHSYSYHLLQFFLEIGPLITISSIAVAVWILLNRHLRKNRH